MRSNYFLANKKRSNRLEAKGETERLPTAVGIALPTVQTKQNIANRIEVKNQFFFFSFSSAFFPPSSSLPTCSNLFHRISQTNQSIFDETM